MSPSAPPPPDARPSRPVRVGYASEVFFRLGLRDLAIAAAVVGAWPFLAPLSAAESALADFVGVLLGLAVAVACYLGHEWGHLAGALATGSRVAAPSSLTAISLFSFDSKRNDRRQFIVMSFSGFAMTGVALGIVYGVLQDGLLATRVARGGVLFLTALTVFIEFPLVFWALLRDDLPPVETFESPTTVGSQPEAPTRA